MIYHNPKIFPSLHVEHTAEMKALKKGDDRDVCWIERATVPFVELAMRRGLIDGLLGRIDE